MKQALFIISIIGSILLNGCVQKPNSAETQKDRIAQTSPVSFAEINQAFKTGASLTKIQNPNLALPEDIRPFQIKYYFQIGNIFLAPVLRTSMNVYFEEQPLPFTTTFSGILAAHTDDQQWQKILEVKDTTPESSSKNNPYYLWEQDRTLWMSVVDQNGAGSGEGVMKAFALEQDNTWKMKDCYYFGNRVEGPDYFSYSSQLSKLDKVQKESKSNCALVEIIPL